MHEIGIAEGIMKRVLGAAADNKASAVTAIGIKIGTLSGVEPRSLEFALDCMKAGTLANDARIDVEIIAASGICDECGKTSMPDTFLSVCGHCGSPALEITAGKEFEISYVDIEE